MTPSRRRHSMFSSRDDGDDIILESASNMVLDCTSTYESPTKWKRSVTYSSHGKKESKQNTTPRIHTMTDCFSPVALAPIKSIKHKLDDALGFDSKEEESKSPKKLKLNPRAMFLDQRNEILDEFLRGHAALIQDQACAGCTANDASYLYTCIDCVQLGLRCRSCILDGHKHLPTHRLKYFNGFHWQRTSLCSLGLVVQLGHCGENCPSTKQDRDVVKITVLDCNGIHDVMVMFCRCGQISGLEATGVNQFIKTCWYPATKDMPRTVATFNLLDEFDSVTCEGKMSGYHFYKSLVRLTDITLCQSISNRYEDFIRMHREYQYLKMIQRSGRTFETLSRSPLHDGDLAIECPACPHSGRNLPLDWDRRVDSWLYTLFVMLDANFRLKSKQRPSTYDVYLGDGLSYFVQSQPYKEHVKTVFDEKDIKYCDSGLRAVDHAHKKGIKGYVASGVFAVQCRHMTILPNAIGDLQLGERQGNADYILLSAIAKRKLKRLVVSYDIACQYSRKFAFRVAKYPKDKQPDWSNIDLEFVIPQFHIAGHGDACRGRYSLRYREHMGRTDGENIERGWATFNGLAMSTKEMGSGSRQDTVDYHLGDWNFQRIVSFGPLFSAKLKEASRECVRHAEAFAGFQNAFPIGVVEEINETIERWNADPDKHENPYAESTHGTTFRRVRQLLAESEKYESVQGTLRSDSISATHWLSIGIELEDLKCKVKRNMNGLKVDKTTVLSTSGVEQNVDAIRRIRAWKDRQIIHMPAIIESDIWEPMPEKEEDGTITDCWCITLQFPSTLTAALRTTYCSAALIEKETKLRIAVAYDSLHEIRSLLQKEWWLIGRKKKHVLGTGQQRNTQSNIAIQSMVTKRTAQVLRYRRSWQALFSLSPNGAWSTSLKALEDGDVRMLEDDEGKGEGRRSPSWIWSVNGAADVSERDVYYGMRVEYAKSRARALRWSEEVSLVKEEMRRVLQFFNWKMNWWIERANQLRSRTDTVALGFLAYANLQVSVLQKISRRFRTLWTNECSIEDLPETSNQPLISISLSY